MILRHRRTSRDTKQAPAAHPIHGQDPGVLPSGEPEFIAFGRFAFLVFVRPTDAFLITEYVGVSHR